MVLLQNKRNPVTVAPLLKLQENKILDCKGQWFCYCDIRKTIQNKYDGLTLHLWWRILVIPTI